MTRSGVTLVIYHTWLTAAEVDVGLYSLLDTDTRTPLRTSTQRKFHFVLFSIKDKSWLEPKNFRDVSETPFKCFSLFFCALSLFSPLSAPIMLLWYEHFNMINAQKLVQCGHCVRQIIPSSQRRWKDYCLYLISFDVLYWLNLCFSIFPHTFSINKITNHNILLAFAFEGVFKVHVVFYRDTYLQTGLTINGEKHLWNRPF